MNVWILEVGCYNDRYVKGVYATREAAIAAGPGGTWKPHGAENDALGAWGNDLDWDLAGTVSSWVVEGDPATAKDEAA